MASWLSCNSNDNATPMPTAAATGRNNVAAKVVTAATCEVRPVRMMVATSRGRSEPMAAKMRMAPSVGTAIFLTSPEKRARMTSIHTPDHIAAHRVRPPTLTLSAVWPTEPPTAMPWKKPEASGSDYRGVAGRCISQDLRTRAAPASSETGGAARVWRL